MRIMKVILALRDRPDRIEIDANPHAVSIEDGVCRVVVPAFDYWTNTKDFSFRDLDVSSKISGEHLLIEFPDDGARVRFHGWLMGAFAEAKEGYKTMWP